MSTGSLWSRGPQIVYARVVTPTTTYETMVVLQSGTGLTVRHAPNDVAQMAEIEAVEDDPLGGWLVQGLTPEGAREVWRVEKVCGCRQAYAHPTAPGDLEALRVLDQESAAS